MQRPWGTKVQRRLFWKVEELWYGWGLEVVRDF